MRSLQMFMPGSLAWEKTISQRIRGANGQVKRVFLDQGYMTEDMLSPDYFRWLYTAFTRATELLYLVNWPEEQTEK
jgi:exodeoxyribonuclease-5